MARAVLALIAVVAAALSGCGHHASAAQRDAQSSCAGYAEMSGRHQVAETAVQERAFVHTTLTKARTASYLDHRWSSLYRDIESYLDLSRLLPRATDRQERQYLAADAQIQDDCSEAGYDIGDLEP